MNYFTYKFKSMFFTKASEPESNSLSSSLTRGDISSDQATTLFENYEIPKTVTSTPRPNDSSFCITPSSISPTGLHMTALNVEDQLNRFPQKEMSPK